MELWKRTPVDDTLFGDIVKVMDSFEDLLNSPNGILLGELALLADAVEKFAAGGQLRNNIKLVLQVGC